MNQEDMIKLVAGFQSDTKGLNNWLHGKSWFDKMRKYGEIYQYRQMRA